jgi:hypothetical protein
MNLTTGCMVYFGSLILAVNAPGNWLSGLLSHIMYIVTHSLLTPHPHSFHQLTLTQSLRLITEPEFSDEIQTKVLRVFLLAIHSHVHSFAFYVFKLTQPLTYFFSSVILPCKGERLCPETSTKLFVHEFGFRGLSSTICLRFVLPTSLNEWLSFFIPL